ncbi:sialate O-acetylesterase [Algoriphagus aquimarinus]|uniref:sialate O-acetylesterase n=1 Tax=Algoriphagus aquimarinus TaxID=237018 RepID=UPI0030DA587A|tara:strand:+ start:441716 stop:443227 length:1512 start_codon:yes stop_codon:yes gene_type:complete
MITQKFFALNVFLLGMLVFSAGYAQELTFTEAPENYRLYARNQNDSAVVRYTGKVTKGEDVSSLTLKVYKDDVLYEIQEVPLIDKAFSITSKIYAGLHLFRFELFTLEGQKESIYMVADNVVCGDAYIITGQSNSHPSSTLSTYSSPFARSFGVKTGYEPYSEEDKNVRWGSATGNCPGLEKEVGGWFIKNPHGVGVWGMELARLIIEKHQVPVCIINGGSGSSSIEENMLYPELPSLETSFGRLAYRVNQAGLKDQVKAIFWHQGETNTNTVEGYQSYPANFDTLKKDWERVYTGVEKIYLFQLHPGCGAKTEGYYNELREIQTQLVDTYDNVEIMSTMGVSGHDGCHFSYQGYLEFAERIFPLVSRDFYGEQPTSVITPPKLLSAKYVTENELELLFDQAIAVEEKREVNGKTYFLKDQFFFKIELDSAFISAMISSIKSQGNKLILTFEKAESYPFVTYLPGKFYTGTHEFYEGPWLTGSANNLGALSFHQREVVPLQKK